jgi:hypothetical protein
MGVNRYTSLTPSQFNPLSMEEIMLVPAMQRKKHDDLLVKQEGIRSGLAKVDPLDVHYDEAIKLKSEIESELDNNAATLAKTGVNDPNVTSKIISLNRRYNDLVAPTGRIGQINTAKQTYDKKKALFLENATKQYGSDRASQLWEQKVKDENTGYKGYDAENKIINIGDYGIVAAEDYEKDLQARNNILGSTMSEIESGGGRVVKNADGSYTAFDSNNRQMTKTNLDQVNQMTAAMRAKWLTPGGAGYSFNQEAGINPENFTAQFQGDMLSQLETATGISNKYSSEEGAAPIGDGSGTLNMSDIYGEDYNTAEVGGSAQDYSEVERIGNTTNTKVGEIEGDGFSPVDAGTGAVSTEIKQGGKTFSVDDIKDPRQKALYENMYKKLTTEGVVGADGKKHFINADGRKKGKNDKTNAQLVVKMLKETPAITLTSKLVTTDTMLDNSGFSSSIGKTADEREKTMRKQLRLTNSGARKLLDPETGQPISFEEAQDKYDLDGVDTVTYHGFISPLNWEEQSFNGTNSKASPHVITVKTKDGTFKEFKTSRLNSDNVGINVDRHNELQENYRNWSVNHNEFVPFKSKSPSLNKLKVKYNTYNPKYDPKRGSLQYEIKDTKGVIHYMTESEFINTVNAVK